MSPRALLTRATPLACSGGAAISRAAVNPAAPPLHFKGAALGASMRAARIWPGKSAAATAGIWPGDAATAGPVKADQVRVFALSWFTGTRPKFPSLASAGRKTSTSDVAASRLPAPKAGSTSTAWMTKPSSARFISTRATLPSLASAGRKISTSDVAASRLPAPKAGSTGTAWMTKPSSARFISTRAKFPAAGSVPKGYLPVVCAVVGGISVVFYVLSGSKKRMDIVDDLELPASVDWSLFPGFPRAADPSYNFNDFCGSCWAVIAVKSVEFAYAIEYGEAPRLSIQQVIDCAAIEGCCGNNLVRAYKYISVAGLTTEEAYPGPPARNRSFWHGLLRGYCRMEGKPVVAKIDGFQRIEPTEVALMRALQTSPVAVYVNINGSFEAYAGGVLEVSQLPPRSEVPDTKHVLLVVGYGTDPDGKKFWKLMNSWGPGWGKDGYCFFRRGCGNAHGVAGMMEHAGFRPVICKTGR